MLSWHIIYFFRLQTLNLMIYTGSPKNAFCLCPIDKSWFISCSLALQSSPDSPKYVLVCLHILPNLTEVLGSNLSNLSLPTFCRVPIVIARMLLGRRRSATLLIWMKGTTSPQLEICRLHANTEPLFLMALSVSFTSFSHTCISGSWSFYALQMLPKGQLIHSHISTKHQGSKELSLYAIILAFLLLAPAQIKLILWAYSKLIGDGRGVQFAWWSVDLLLEWDQICAVLISYIAEFGCFSGAQSGPYVGLTIIGMIGGALITGLAMFFIYRRRTGVM